MTTNLTRTMGVLGVVVTVPQMQGCSDASYEVSLGDDADAIAAAVRDLGAVEVDGDWYYRAEETGEVYECDSYEMAAYGAGLLDERGVDYSLWCTVSGSIVGDPSAEVLDALGE